MLSGWTAVQTATLAAALVALIGSIFSTIYTVRAQKKRSRLESSVAAAAEQIDKCKQQLSEFYRPLQQHRASSSLLRELLPDHPWRLVQHLAEIKASNEASVVDMILAEGDKIVEILKANIVHQEVSPNSKELRRYFVYFMKHQVLLRAAWSRLEEADNDGVDLNQVRLQEIAETPFSLNLDDCISAEVDRVHIRIAKLHGLDS